MIRISHRDITALFGDEFANEYEMDYMSKLVNYEDYTPEVIETLTEMYNDGKLQSRPMWDRDDTIRWRGKAKHRPDNLPAVIQKGGTEFYYVDGKKHRSDGPAVVELSPNRKAILWFKDDRLYGSMDSYKSGTIGTTSGYKDAILKNFPEAGDKIWIWDWTDIPQNLIDKFKETEWFKDD